MCVCFFFNKFIYFIFGCVGSLLLHAGPSLVAASKGHSPLWCTGFSLWWPLPLGARALGARASVVVAHGLSCSAACGILPDQGSNPCPLHWQADSQPLSHQRSPLTWTIFKVIIEFCYNIASVLVFWPQGMWDLSSPTRDRTCTPCIERRSLNHWTAREVPSLWF